jgi:hypothetical protein
MQTYCFFTATIFYANALQCYVICTLPVLSMLTSHLKLATWIVASHRCSSSNLLTWQCLCCCIFFTRVFHFLANVWLFWDKRHACLHDKNSGIKTVGHNVKNTAKSGEKRLHGPLVPMEDREVCSVGMWTDLVWTMVGSMVDCWEYSHKLPGSIEGGKYVYLPSWY